MASSVARIFARRFLVSSRRGALSAFNMPAMSLTISEGGIASWNKKEGGETFSTRDVLLEIETDKAPIDVEAQDDGILAKILAQDGAKNVQVGAVIAAIAEGGDDISGAADFAKNAPFKSSPKEGTPPPKAEKPTPSSKPSPSDSSAKTEAKAELASGQRIFASPIVKKITLERGIPLAQIQGSVPGGGIIHDDVESFKPAVQSSTTQTASPSSDYVDTPVSNMRLTIGARLTQSKQELPHDYMTVDNNMDKILKLREVFDKTLTEKAKEVIRPNETTPAGALCPNGRYIVKFKHGTLRNFASQMPAGGVSKEWQSFDLFVGQFDRETLDGLRNHPDVEAVEPDSIVRIDTIQTPGR